MNIELEKKLSEESAKLLTRIESLKSEAVEDVLKHDEFKKVSDALLNSIEQKQKIEQMEAAIKRMSDSQYTIGEKSDSFDLEQKARFEDFLRKGKDGSLEVKDLRTDSNPDGGYVVRPAFSAFIAQRVFETSPLRQHARIETISTNSLEVLIDDNEAGASWVGEGSLGSDATTPQIGKIVIPVHKLATKPKASTESLEDPIINLESWLQAKVADKFGRSENIAFVAGNGVGKPKGILDYSAWTTAGTYERGKLERVKSGSNGAFTVDGLIGLQNALPEVYQGNAKFFLKRGSFGEILKLKSTNIYHFIGLSPADRGGVVNLTLLGKPVVFCDDVQAAGTTGNLGAIYGDLSQGYTIVDRAGIQVIRDPYTTDGFVIYKTYKRVGGAVTNYQAIKVQNLDA